MAQEITGRTSTIQPTHPTRTKSTTRGCTLPNQFTHSVPTNVLIMPHLQSFVVLQVVLRKNMYMSSLHHFSPSIMRMQFYRFTVSYRLHITQMHCKVTIPKICNKGIARPQSQFPHVLYVSVSDLKFLQSVFLFCYRKICGPILGIYKSLTDT